MSSKVLKLTVVCLSGLLSVFGLLELIQNAFVTSFSGGVFGRGKCTTTTCFMLVKIVYQDLFVGYFRLRLDFWVHFVVISSVII